MTPPPLTPAPLPTAATAPTMPQRVGRGIQTGLLQRRQPAFWLFVVLMVFAGLEVINEQLTYLSVFPTAWILSLVLLALYVVPVAIAIYVLDLFEREPLSLLIAAFLWGAVVAIALSGPTNSALADILGKLFGADVAARWGAALTAPFVEETFKFLGVVTIYLIARNEIDDLLDGFVYGALVGLGFAAVENVYYFIVKGVYLGAGGANEIGPVIELFMLRVVFFGAYMHVLWTGLTGLGLAYFVTRRDEPVSKRWMVMGGLFAAGVAAHLLWNSPLLTELAGGDFGLFVYGAVKGLPFLIFLGILVVLAQRREHAWFEGTMAAHLDTDVITPEEMAQLRGLRSRWQARRAVAQRKGPAGGALMKRLQAEQIKLALLLSHTHDENDPAVTAQRDVVRAIRRDLQALPDAAPAAAAVYSPALAAPVVAPSFVPTHYVPPAGMQAWDAPEPSRPPVATLAAGVQLQVVEQNGAWSKVVGSNGWTGWVDGRLLLAYG